MAAPYSQDLRDRVVAAIASGRSARSAARAFSISVSAAVRWGQRLREEGHAEARPMGGDRRSRLTARGAEVLTLVAETPDLTLAEIRSALAARYGLEVGISTISRFLARHQVTFKKKACAPLNKSEKTLPKADRILSAASRLWTRNGSFSSTRRLSTPR